MRVTKFSSIKQHRIFRDFSWPADLLTFGSKNLIYGWNGTGKSTLTEIFRALEKRRAVEGKVSINFGDRLVLGENIANETSLPQVKVFNKGYIDENIFTPEKRASAIFYIGQESIEKQKRIEALNAQVVDKDKQISLKIGDKQKFEKELDGFCQDKANNTIKTLLRSGGSNTYNNYNKSNFRGKADAFIILTDDQLKAKQLEDKKYQELISLTRSSAKELIKELPKLNLDVETLKDLAEKALSKTVISQIIKELDDDDSLSKWIETGLGLHKNEMGFKQECAFCKNPLSQDRGKEIEGHFNDAYNIFIEETGNLIGSIEAKWQSLHSTILPAKSVFYDSLAEEFTSEAMNFSEQLQSALNFLESIKTELEGKKKTPFKQLLLSTEIPTDLDISTTKLNVLIKRNNAETSSFNKSVIDARLKIEEHIIASCLADFRVKKDNLEQVQQEIETLTKTKNDLSAEVLKLELSVREDLKPAEELNHDIQSYLGRSELKFSVKENGYELTRGDSLAENLSEGEKTAIAFLHFLKSLSDKNFDLANGIVVIDDPISSLDSNSIYHAFGFMKAKSESAGQLFILTHNHTFFRQVKNWFNHLPKQKQKVVALKPARFYMIQSNIKEGERSSELAPLDSLLHEFESEYHYLFSVVRRAAEENRGQLREAYPLPNISRRLLETFLAFKNPGSGSLQGKMDLIQFDTAKKSRILRFVHTYSHFDQITDSEHDPSILQESPAIMRDVLEFLKTVDESHFTAMENLFSEENIDI